MVKWVCLKAVSKIRAVEYSSRSCLWRSCSATWSVARRASSWPPLILAQRSDKASKLQQNTNDNQGNSTWELFFGTHSGNSGHATPCTTSMWKPAYVLSTCSLVSFWSHLVRSVWSRVRGRCRKFSREGPKGAKIGTTGTGTIGTGARSCYCTH